FYKACSLCWREAATYGAAAHGVPGMIASRMLVESASARETLHVVHARASAEEIKCARRARVTAWTTRETSDYDPATARVSPATRQTTRATRRVPPPTLRRREETYHVRRGNGRRCPATRRTTRATRRVPPTTT